MGGGVGWAASMRGDAAASPARVRPPGGPGPALRRGSLPSASTISLVALVAFNLVPLIGVLFWGLVAPG